MDLDVAGSNPVTRPNFPAASIGSVRPIFACRDQPGTWTSRGGSCSAVIMRSSARRAAIGAASTLSEIERAEPRNHLVQLPTVLVLRGLDRPKHVEDQISPLVAHAIL